MQEGMPVFVKIDEYKDILDIVNLIKNKLDNAKAIIGRVTELKSQEDAQIESWHNSLEEAEQKLEMIDRTLFKPETA